MSGYTPLFDSVLDGTLFGKWPHTGVWCALLSQCNKKGEIDVNPALIIAKLGISKEEFNKCIHDFMQPDPHSRSAAEEGRRLVLIDPTVRDWGWLVVNHPTYREKARKSSYDAQRTETGRDAERKRLQREADAKPKASRDVPPRPDASRVVPLSEATPNTNTNTEPPLPPEGDGGVNVELDSTDGSETYSPFEVPTTAAPHVQFAVVLRNHSVLVNPQHPTLVAWEREGLTLEAVAAAVVEARRCKPRERFQPQYVDAILRNNAARAPPSRPRLTKYEQAAQTLAAATEGDDDDDSS